jgi:hypothetical protein
MTKIPNIVRDRLKAAQAGDHPDANLLTAFAEQTLPDRERIPVLEHVARCADCRDVLTLAIPPLAATAAPGHKDTASARKGSWFGWPMLRWGALAACVVVVGTAVFVRHDLRRSQTVAYMKSDAVPQAPENVGPPPPAISENAVSNLITKEEKQEPDRARKAEHDKKSAFAAAKPVVPAHSAPASALVDYATRAKEGSGREDAYIALPNNNEVPSRAAAGLSGGSVRRVPSPAAPQPLPGKDEVLIPPAPNLPVAGRNAMNAVNGQVPPKASEPVQVSGANEVVEVQSAVQAEASTMQYSQKKETLGKAKGAAADSSVVTLPASATNFEDKTLTAAAETRASRLEAELAHGAFASSTRWTISSDGQLQHSVDSGKTWQPVTVADKATFRALSANGPDLWVGGPAGLLYHSSDAGGHWTQIKPVADSTTLTTDIATIEFTDRQHGKLTTSTGEIWITADAGLTWRKQQS